LCKEPDYNPDDWFPERGQSSEQARAICRRCLVQRECLAYALDMGDKFPGIWGGTSGRERRRLLESGKVSGALVRKWGVAAVEGWRIER
jgi:WhiB family redox-sensing transcriptional regulator